MLPKLNMASTKITVRRGVDMGSRPTMAGIIRRQLKRIAELEAENARLRQQRDAANALVDYVMDQIADGKE